MNAFVGRDQELHRLNQHLENARGGQGRVVFLTGEPGAGKSTLISRFMIDAALRYPETRIIGSACSEQYGAAEPYQPFVEAFRSLLSEREGPSGGWSELKEIAAEVAPHWIAAIPLAGGLIAASMSTASELKKMGGGVATAASEEALFFQYTELFLAAAAKHPIVLFIDDLHWADRASVSLLTHLARRVERERVLILGTYRPADVDLASHPIRKARLELERYGMAEELALSPLDSAANTALIREELGGPPTPQLLEWLERQAGSNPLFFSELLRWLSEQGLIRAHHGEWTLDEVPETFQIPRSAEATIEHRLGRLEPEVYRLIEYASVEGNEFGSTTLAELLGMDELELEEALEPLARLHRLIRMVDTRDLPNGEPSSIYQFSHSLFQTVLHRNLQGKRRILLHRKMAEILERLYATDTSPVAHKLAIHFDEGRQPARAYEFALQGAERARRLYAHRDAIELIRRALRNAEGAEQKLRAQELLGDTSHFIARHADALAAYAEALSIAAANGDRLPEIRLRRKQAAVELDSGEETPSKIQQRLDELAAQAAERDASDELCDILWLLNILPNEPGAATIERARKALEICRREGDRGRVSRAEYNLARALVLGPDPQQAVPHLEASLRISEELEDRFHIGDCENVLGVLHLFLGDYRAAAQHFDAAARAFDDVGAPYHEAGVRNNLGVLLTRLGEFQAAEENLIEAIRLNQRLEAAATLLHPLENLADLFQTSERWTDARNQWQVLLEHAQQSGYWNAEVIARCGIGLADIELGELDAAAAEERAAQAILQHHDAWSEARAAYHFLSARLSFAAGELDGAVHFLLTAEGELEKRDPYMWATFRLLRAEMLSAVEPATAGQLATDSLAVFERIGSARMRARAHSILAIAREHEASSQQRHDTGDGDTGDGAVFDRRLR